MLSGTITSYVGTSEAQPAPAPVAAAAKAVDLRTGRVEGLAIVNEYEAFPLNDGIFRVHRFSVH